MNATATAALNQLSEAARFVLTEISDARTVGEIVNPGNMRATLTELRAAGLTDDTDALTDLGAAAVAR